MQSQCLQYCTVQLGTSMAAHTKLYTHYTQQLQTSLVNNRPVVLVYMRVNVKGEHMLL